MWHGSGCVGSAARAYSDGVEGSDLRPGEVWSLVVARLSVCCGCAHAPGRGRTVGVGDQPALATGLFRPCPFAGPKKADPFSRP